MTAAAVKDAGEHTRAPAPRVGAVNHMCVVLSQRARGTSSAVVAAAPWSLRRGRTRSRAAGRPRPCARQPHTGTARTNPNSQQHGPALQVPAAEHGRSARIWAARRSATARAARSAAARTGGRGARALDAPRDGGQRRESKDQARSAPHGVRLPGREQACVDAPHCVGIVKAGLPASPIGMNAGWSRRRAWRRRGSGAASASARRVWRCPSSASRRRSAAASPTWDRCVHAVQAGRILCVRSPCLPSTRHAAQQRCCWRGAVRLGRIASVWAPRRGRCTTANTPQRACTPCLPPTHRTLV